MKQSKINIFFLLLLLFLISIHPSIGQDRPKIGLVLSGGSAKGFAHIGALRVLEEAGIYPDYIAGTSMGAVIGGLYACGYDSKTIEEIAFKIDWDRVLLDNITRDDLQYRDRVARGQYLFSIPVSKEGIDIKGLVKGFNITNYLTGLTIGYHDVEDFSELKIPFLCVSTNIETAEAVVHTGGSLPKAIRASMSIPSAFQPAQVDGLRLVDGGLMNNFPVFEAIDMGADIIIGVDVRYEKNNSEHINNIADIMMQAILMHSEKTADEKRPECDILISPDLSDYNGTEFDKYAEIIEIGEQAAREVINQILMLSDSLKTNQWSKASIDDKFIIDSIEIDGYIDIDPAFMKKVMQLDSVNSLTRFEIIRKVEKLYGTQYFDLIDYKVLEYSPKRYKIQFTPEPRKNRNVNIGINYNSYDDASIFLNTQYHFFSDVPGLLSLSMKLSRNPYLKVTYLRDRGLKPGLNVNFAAKSNIVYKYTDNQRVRSLNYRNVKLSAGINSFARNNMSASMGIVAEYESWSPDISDFESSSGDNFIVSYRAGYEFDNFNRFTYPTRGTQFKLHLNIVTDNLNIYQGEEDPVLTQYSYFDQIIPINNRLVFDVSLYGKTTIGDSIPYGHKALVGGFIEEYMDEAIPFYGIDLLQVERKSAIVARTTARMRFFKSNYVSLFVNTGVFENSPKALFGNQKWYTGYGVKFSFEVISQPLEISLAYSDYSKRIFPFINFGFYF